MGSVRVTDALGWSLSSNACISAYVDCRMNSLAMIFPLLACHVLCWVILYNYVVLFIRLFHEFSSGVILLDFPYGCCSSIQYLLWEKNIG
jgi:hypothetical protein